MRVIDAKATDPNPSSRPEPARHFADAQEVWSFDRYDLAPGRRLLEHDGQPVKLGSRAIELLIALVRSAGEVQRSEHLIADVWGRDVDDINLRVHIAALRRALGEATHGAPYIVNEPGVGYVFAVPVSRRAALVPAERELPQDARRGSHRLPRPASIAVGRDPIIADLVEQVLTKTLITLVGAPGVGKSTLALAVAARLVSQFAGNVGYADLSTLTDPQDVVEILCGAITELTEGLPEHRLRDVPGSMLLVLDNCERVAARVAEVVVELRRRHGATLHVLATSREPLLVQGEWVHRALPLAVPKDDGEIALSEAMACGSVQLFVARMPARDEEEVCASDTRLICEICRRLDGIPLAIEMAAARVESLGILGLSLQLGIGFEVLAGGRRTALPHHQTMDAAIGWSHESLSERQKATLCRLAVFQGEFSLDTAQALVADGIGRDDTSWDIAELVRKSLVNADSTGDSVRYSMYACLRGYALQTLKARGELDAVVRRYARLLVEALPSSSGTWLTRPRAPRPRGVVPELDDVRWVLQRLATLPTDEHLRRSLLAASSSLWFEHPNAAEYCGLLETEIGGEGAPNDAMQMQLQFSLGHARLHCSGPDPRATQAFEASYAIARQAGDMHHQRLALRGLWIAWIASGDYASSLRAARQHRRLTQGEGASEGQATDRMLMLSYLFLGRHALVSRCRGRVPPASHLSFEASPPTIYQLDDDVTTDSIGARSLWLSGRVDSAIELARCGLSRARQIDHTLSECAALSCLCCVCLWSGRHDEARRCAGLLMGLATQHSLGKWQVWAQAYLDSLEVADGADRPRWIHSARGLRQLEVMVTFSGRFLDEGVARRVEEGSAPWCAPEVLRARGELLLELGTAQSRDGAHRYFRRAINMSKRQGALSWELRSTMSLARLLASTGQAGQGERMVRAVCERFTEGFESKDMVTAMQFMQSLRDAARARNMSCAVAT